MMPTTTWAPKAALIASVIAGSVVAGCGGSSSADPLNKSQFVQEANSICQSADAERSEALKDAEDGNPKLSELTTDALQPVEEMTEELGELGAPASEKGKVDAIVAAFEASIDEVRADPADPTAAIAAFAEPNQLAEEYGLTDCTI